jgi:hypothetical protein
MSTVQVKNDFEYSKEIGNAKKSKFYLRTLQYLAVFVQYLATAVAPPIFIGNMTSAQSYDCTLYFGLT